MNFLSDNPTELAHAVAEAKLLTGESIDLSGRGVRERIEAEIARAQRALTSMIVRSPDGRIRIWRALSLDEEALARLQPGAALGECWSFDERGAFPFDGRSHLRTIVVEALVEEDDVFWSAVVAMWSSGEAEARLRSSSQVEVAAIRDKSGAQLRQDLIGCEMGAAHPIEDAMGVSKGPQG